MTEQREASIKKALEFCIEYFDKEEAIKRIITFIKDEEAINYIRCCENSIADFQIDDKITFKQHRSGTVTDVYINELQVKDVNGNYKTIGKNDVIEKH